MLLLAGGLQALQSASIAAGVPLTVILLFMMYGLVKTLREDYSGAPVIVSGRPVSPSVDEVSAE